MRGLIIGKGSAGQRHLTALSNALPRATHAVLGSREWDALMQSDRSPIEDLWQELNPALVIIASPASRHADHLASVLAFGVPTMVEKPLFKNLGEVPSAKPFSSDMSARIQVGYVLRHSPSYQRFREVLVQRGVRDVRKVTVRAHSFLPWWRPHRDYRQSVSAQSDLGGGALLELSHEIDYVLALFGDLDITYAHLKTSPLLEVDVETECRIEGVLSTGARLEMSLDLAEQNEERWCNVEWENGLSIRWDIRSQRISTWRETKPLACEVFSKNRDDWYLAQLKHFLRVVSGGAQPLPGVHEGFQVMRVIEEVRSASDRL